jgi:hypothetical protein
MKSIVSFNTKNNTYHLIKISKTTYEELQEYKAERNYMILQRTIGIILTVISLIMLLNGLIPALLTIIVGIAVTLSKDHVLSL